MTSRTPRDTTTPITQRPRKSVKISRKALELVLTIHDLSFNYAGAYFLKLSVHSLYTGDYSDVQVRLQDREHLHESELRTEITPDLHQDEVTTLEVKNYHFYLPIGFCKNDEKHDVYLNIQAYRVNPDTAKGELIGEAKFAIYPRLGEDVDYDVDFGDPMYTISDRLNILRHQSLDKLNMHCGKIVYTAILRETTPHDDDIPPPESEPATPRRELPPIKIQSPIESPEPLRGTTDRGADKGPARKTPRGGIPPRIARDGPAPLFGDDGERLEQFTEWRQLAPEGLEEVSVIVHGATGLWAKAGKGLIAPRAYVTIKSKFQEDNDIASNSVTNASGNQTSDPSWEQAIHIQYDADRAEEEVAILTVADSETRQTLVEYRLPVNKLTPFHHYHLDMSMASLTDTEESHVYATVVRKQYTLPAQLPDHPYVALKAILRNVISPIDNPVSALMAVGSIVTDFPNYKRSGIYAKTIDVQSRVTPFPHPNKSTFDIPKFQGHGQPQIALPGRPMGKPEWNFPFLFCQEQEISTLFTRGAALIVEYYLLQKMKGMEWPIESPIGYSVVPLDQRVFQILSSNPNGFKVEVPIQGYLRTIHQNLPYVSIVLQLMKDKVVVNSSPVKYDQLPDLVYGPKPDETSPSKQVATNGETGKNTRFEESLPPIERVRPKKSKFLLKDDEFPPEDALERVLPEYQYIFQENGRKVPPPPPDNPVSLPSNPSLPAPAQTTLTQPVSNSYPQAAIMPNPGAVTYIDTGGARPLHADGRGFAVQAVATEEVDRYRAAIKKMGAEILALRDRVRELEGSNSTLRHDLHNYNDVSKVLLDSMDLDSLSKQDLASRYVAIKQRLQGVTNELTTYKDKVHRLQNDLIRKNDITRNHYDVSTAHQSQNLAIQRLQDKVKKMEKLQETVKHQESIISALEAKLSNSKKPLAPVKEVKEEDSLLDENRRLQREIEELKRHKRDGDKSKFDNAERLELMQVLERSEARIASLEKKLSREKRARSRGDRERKLDELSIRAPCHLDPLTPVVPIGYRHYHHHRH